MNKYILPEAIFVFTALILELGSATLKIRTETIA